MPVSATIEKLPEATAVVTLSGHLTLGSSLSLADSQIQRAIADGVTRLVIDLTGVDFVDSAGLGMLVFAYGALNQKNGSLRLCGVLPRILSLLKVTRMDSYLPIDPTRVDSLSALSS